MPTHTPEDMLRTQQNVINSYSTSLPSMTESATYDIYEEEKDEFKEEPSLTKETERQQKREQRREKRRLQKAKREERRDKRRKLREEADPYAGMSRKQKRAAIAQRKAEELAQEEVTVFKHRNFNEFMEEQNKKELSINWTGAKENSLLVHASSVVRGWFDEEYVPEHSIHGRNLARLDILKEIKAIGPAMLSEKNKVKRLKDLWDQNHVLRMKNEFDERMMEADAPSLAEMAEAIMEHPKETGYAIAQALVDKPELILVPQVAGARGIAAASAAAKAVGAGARVVQVSKVVGGLTAAGLGGLTVGTIDRELERSGKSGEVDLFRSMEQSQTDALLGAVTFGGGKVLTRGVSSVKARNLKLKEAKINATSSITERNLKNAGFYRTLQDRVDNSDPAKEIYADANGHVYEIEVKQLLDLNKSKEDVLNMKQKYEQDFEALRYLDGELEKINKQIETTTSEIPEMLLKSKGDIEAKILELEPNKSVMERFFLNAEREGVDTHNFIEMLDVNGESQTLRRVTPEMFGTGQVKVDGLPGLILDNEFKTTKTPNDLVTIARGAFITATSPIRSLSKTSPTAKLLYDKFNPNSSEGRANLDTMQEEVKAYQGIFLSKSKEILEDASIIAVKSTEATHKELMEHMRGVRLSEDPAVLRAAEGYRGLLNDVKDYVKSKGVELDDADDFLPRYYNQSILETPEARTKMADAIMKSFVEKQSKIKDLKPEDAAKQLKEKRAEVEQSIIKIKENLAEGSDEIGLIYKGGKSNPIGNRKWKDVLDADLNEFLDPNFVGGIERYIINAVTRAEAESVFGSGGSRIPEFKQQIIKELEEATGSDVGARRMTEQESLAIDDMYKLAAGVYGGKANRSAKAVTDGVMAATNLVSLPLVALTSFTEPLSMLHRLHETSGVRAILDTYTELPIIRKMKASFGDMTYDQKVKEFQEMSATNDVAVAERLLAITGEGLEGWPAKINNTFMKANGLHHWTQLNRRKAYEASKRDILKAIKGLVKEDKPEMDQIRRRHLTELGIDPDLATQWVKEGADITNPLYNRVKRGSMRMANTMIANPDKFNKAKLLSSNHSALRVMGQFKSFGSTFVSSVMTPTYKEVIALYNSGNKIKAARKLASGFSVLAAMSLWTAYNRDMLFEGEFGEDKERKIANSFLSMSVPAAGILAPLYDGYGLRGFLGPMAGTIDRVTQNPDVKSISPTITKMVDLVDEKL